MKIYQIEGFGYSYDHETDGYNTPVAWYTHGVYTDRAVAEEDCQKLNGGCYGDNYVPDSTSKRTYNVFEVEVITSSHYTAKD